MMSYLLLLILGVFSLGNAFAQKLSKSDVTLSLALEQIRTERGEMASISVISYNDHTALFKIGYEPSEHNSLTLSFLAAKSVLARVEEEILSSPSKEVPLRFRSLNHDGQSGIYTVRFFGKTTGYCVEAIPRPFGTEVKYFLQPCAL